MSWSIGKDLKLRRPLSQNSLWEKATLNPNFDFDFDFTYDARQQISALPHHPNLDRTVQFIKKNESSQIYYLDLYNYMH